MRIAIIGLMLVSVTAVPAQAERFAIACKGKELMGIGPAGRGMAGGEHGEKAIFVVDEEARTVGRYQKKDGTLEDVCVFHLICDRNFSATRVTIGASMPDRMARFDWDRAAGTLDIRYQLHMDNGNVMASRSTLTCMPAEMPKLAGAAG